MMSSAELEKFIKSLGSKYEDDLLACAVSAYLAGNRIVKRDFDFGYEAKGDKHVEHHAVISEADVCAQEVVFEATSTYLPRAYLIGEEADKDTIKKPQFARFANRIVTGENYQAILESSKVEITDPLDGTAKFAMLTGDWSVSVGMLDKMKHSAAAIYSPNFNYRETASPLLILAAADTPTFKITNSRVEGARPIAEKAVKKRFVYYGSDAPFLSPEGFLKSYTNSAWTGSTNGSCALGMALVATGDSHAFYQPEQRVWDWAAGKLLVERAGGYIIFYEVGHKLREMGLDADFKIKRIDKFQPYHYDPDNKPVGFVAAGDKETAEEYFEMLQDACEKDKDFGAKN